MTRVNGGCRGRNADHRRSSQNAWIVSLGQSLTIGRLMTSELLELILSLAFAQGFQMAKRYQKVSNGDKVLKYIDMY